MVLAVPAALVAPGRLTDFGARRMFRIQGTPNPSYLAVIDTGLNRRGRRWTYRPCTAGVNRAR